MATNRQRFSISHYYIEADCLSQRTRTAYYYVLMFMYYCLFTYFCPIFWLRFILAAILSCRGIHCLPVQVNIINYRGSRCVQSIGYSSKDSLNVVTMLHVASSMFKSTSHPLVRPRQGDSTLTLVSLCVMKTPHWHWCLPATRRPTGERRCRHDVLKTTRHRHLLRTDDSQESCSNHPVPVENDGCSHVCGFTACQSIILNCSIYVGSHTAENSHTRTVYLLACRTCTYDAVVHVTIAYTVDLPRMRRIFVYCLTDAAHHL